jgi:hydroxymethylpyrimidine pyrophosphatase-like HAD family hydrolase
MTSRPAAVHVAEEQKLKYKLIALDLDGTTLTTDKKITETTASAIHHAYARGATICVASGRMPYRIMGYASQLPALFYAAAFSGGCAFRVEDGKIQEYLKDYPMPAAAIDGFLDLMATQEGGEDTFGIYERECLYITNPSVADDLKKVCGTQLAHWP